MSKFIAYAGPSITAQDRAAYDQIEFLPPIEEGDLLRLDTEEVTAVGIIDGYFGDRRSVSHKEILWVLSKGVAVWGAASMGALRAAELDSYGMVGLGDIYADYRSGRLTDDGDVAVSHGPGELGYPALTVALVDVHATLKALLNIGSISRPETRQAMQLAQRIDFRERSWAEVAHRLGGLCYDKETWLGMLEKGHVERKRLNALDLLERLTTASRSNPVTAPLMAPPLSYSFRQDLERAGLSAGWPDIDDEDDDGGGDDGGGDSGGDARPTDETLP